LPSLSVVVAVVRRFLPESATAIRGKEEEEEEEYVMPHSNAKRLDCQLIFPTSYRRRNHHTLEQIS